MNTSIQIRIALKIAIIALLGLIFIAVSSCSQKIMTGKQTVKQTQKENQFTGFSLPK